MSVRPNGSSQAFKEEVVESEKIREDFELFVLEDCVYLMRMKLVLGQLRLCVIHVMHNP